MADTAVACHLMGIEKLYEPTETVEEEVEKTFVRITGDFGLPEGRAREALEKNTYERPSMRSSR